MNTQISQCHVVIQDNIVHEWKDKTIFNHYESPVWFMRDVLKWEGVFPDGTVPKYIEDGKRAFLDAQNVDASFNKLYADVSKKVKDKLITRGFTTSMLYSTVGFTSQKTGIISKQRLLLGKRDCYFKDSSMDDGKLFHDIYINLSYDSGVSNITIQKNAYALYALTRELSNIVPMRIFVVNHVNTNTPTCYSYVLKKFGASIKAEEFLFFVGASKRTFGFASYNIMNNGYRNPAGVGKPQGTVSIAEFNLDVEIDAIFDKLQDRSPHLFR